MNALADPLLWQGDDLTRMSHPETDTVMLIEDGPFVGMPKNQYGVIYADPPWHFATRSPKGDGRSASQHYNTMKLAEIQALPVLDLAAKDCMLLMWAIDSMLPEALDVIKAWGFKFKTTGFTWTKKNRVADSDFVGMGYWTRGNPEVCLLATRGRPIRLKKDVRQLIVTPRREHSRKPDEMYGRIERLVGGPYLEMFSRSAQPNWDAWGNQLGRFQSNASERHAPPTSKGVEESCDVR